MPERTRSGRVGSNAWRALALASLVSGCGEVGSEPGSEVGSNEPEPTTSALLAPICGSIQEGNCSDFWGSLISSATAFDIQDGMQCTALGDGSSGTTVYNKVACTFPSGVGIDQAHPGGYVNLGQKILGKSITSLAVGQHFPGSLGVYMLDLDGVVRASFGKRGLTGPQFYTAGNFDTVRTYVMPVDISGNQLCLDQIAFITLPHFTVRPGNIPVADTDLIARSCAGKVYVRTKDLASASWTPAAQAGPPWNGIPSGSFLEISHATKGARLLSSHRRVYAVGYAKNLLNGTYLAPSIRTTPITSPLHIMHVGGDYILVGSDQPGACDTVSCADDPNTLWKWNGSRFVVNGVSVPIAPNDGVSPWERVVDGSTFSSTTGGFGLGHAYGRAYSYRP